LLVFFISLFYYFISAAQDSELNQTLNPFQTLNLRTVLERKRRSFETHNSTPPSCGFSHLHVIPTNDQPSSSNLAIQVCTPPRTTTVPSPPTLFLDSSILADVCENIFQDLNKLVQARNNLIHEDNYVKQWRRLRERVDFIISELERSSLDAQDTT